MHTRPCRRLARIIAPILIGLLSFMALLAALHLAVREVVASGITGRVGSRLSSHAIPPSKSASPTLQLLAFQPADEGYLFSLRLGSALSHTQYVITAYHHTDIDYPQQTITVTTGSAGLASARIWSRCTYQDVLTGYVFARLETGGQPQTESNHLACPALQTVGDFGSHLVAASANDDWIYRPAPPGPGQVRIWLRDASGRAGLTGSIRIHPAGGSSWLADEALIDAGGGLYAYTWTIDGLPGAGKYRVQLGLEDGWGGLSGLDAFVQLSGRATWIWGEAVDGGNPAIWAILTNGDHDGNGRGDRDDWLAFIDAPYGSGDPYVATSYLSVYPYIAFNGTAVTGTFQTFLSVAHSASGVRVEALAGSHQWVESDSGLADGKDLCDAILDFNRAGATPAGRFDGIHFDVEHDDWYTGSHWSRYLELIGYCQSQVNLYNQSHEPVLFGVDVPPHFLNGSGNSGAIKSAWDVLSSVDYITLMDYRDFAGVRWDGRTDGIIPRAEAFMVDGNALGKPVIIGVELTPNRYDHVTFFEESRGFMENELRQVSRDFAVEPAYGGIAMHDYQAWKEKERRVFLPLILRDG
jgi:hypothetical protein